MSIRIINGANVSYLLIKISLLFVNSEVEKFDRVRKARGLLLVSIPIAWLDEPALADVTLEVLATKVTPYVISHVAKLPSSDTTLATD